MSTPDSVLCLEFVTTRLDHDPLVSRVFIVDKFIASQVMHNQRSRWDIRSMESAEVANEWLVARIRTLEQESNLRITVEPGTVALHESEFNRLEAGGVIPPSLRIRIRQRIRREHARS